MSKSTGRSGKLRGHPKDSPDVRLSKTLSWILRHGAASEGLYMRPDGYVRVADMVRYLGRAVLPLSPSRDRTARNVEAPRATYDARAAEDRAG